MSMTIISCPSCDTILLADTVQCPSCRHVLQPDRFALMSQALEAQERAAEAEASEEMPCPACGEGVRPGLVRCFNCGTYLNSDAADAQLQQQASSLMSQRGASYTSGLPDEVGLAPEDPPAYAPDEETTIAEDDDFEISPAFALRAPTAHLETYSLAWGSHAAAAGEAPAEAPPAPVGEATADAPAAPPAAAEPAAPAAAPSSQEIPVLDETAHSIATAGEVLLKIALDEEQSASGRRAATAGARTVKRRRGRAIPKTQSGLIVYCPNGHQIEAQSKHRGLMGRCPKCKMPFFVPNLDLAAVGPPATPEGAAAAATPAMSAEGAAAAATAPLAVASVVTVGGVPWLTDMLLHAVDPTKVKAKPGCLAKSFKKVDVAFRAEGLLIVTLVKPGGMFGLGGKKPEPVREAVRTHLAEGKALAELPAASQQEYPVSGLAGLTVVQPPAYAHESPFGDVPVFGEGKIGVKLPDVGEAAEKQFLSFSLSLFREFAGLVRSLYGLDSFASNVSVPLTDSYTEHTCHFSEAKLQALNDVVYYQNDPIFKLDVIGRKCAECGLIVSEDARKKEKIGGLDGKGIAKAKCPKCQKKFGNVSLYGFGSPK